MYSLLAAEYAQYFDYENAKKYYEKAIGLYEQLGEVSYSINKLLFDYATLHLTFRHFDEALHYYEKVLERLSKQNDTSNFGSTYHQIGMVYEEQRGLGSGFGKLPPGPQMEAGHGAAA